MIGCGFISLEGPLQGIEHETCASDNLNKSLDVLSAGSRLAAERMTMSIASVDL